MAYVIANDVADDSPVGVPLIGYDNIVTVNNITASTASDGFPITNVANPATHLKWIGGVNTGVEVIAIQVGAEVDYVAIAGHNWGTLGLQVQVSTQYTPITMLHFEAGESPAAFRDSADTPHVWLPQGNATINSADFKFGLASGLFDGTGDYLVGDGSSDFAFGTGDFTIDFWIKFNSVPASGFLLYDSRPNGVQGLYPTIYKNGSNQIVYFTNSVDRIVGTTVVTTGVWYHIAVTRTSGVTRLYLNGVQESGTYTDSNNYLNGTSRPTIAASGTVSGTLALDGRLDEFHIIKGTAQWTTSTFSVPSTAYPDTEVQLLQDITDDSALILRFAPQFVTTLFIVLTNLNGAAEAAVIYCGNLLVLERSITIGKGHVPITFGRHTNILNGMSESGNFLGRIVLGEYRESKAEFEWFTPDFYRSDIDAFLEAAQEIPFFWAWSPDEYPDEVGYVWLTNNAVPEVDPATRRIALTLEMRGIA